jgi:hypothetical protein
MNLGYNKDLYVQPFDHRGSFQVKLFGWAEAMTDAQTAEIAATKQVIFCEPLVGLRAKKTSRETAVADSPSLRGVVHVFEAARAS